MLVVRLEAFLIPPMPTLLSLSKVDHTKMPTLSWSPAKSLDVKLWINSDEGKSAYTRKNILDKHVYINDVQPFSSSFSDSGLFGIKLAGSASHVVVNWFRLAILSILEPRSLEDLGMWLMLMSKPQKHPLNLDSLDDSAIPVRETNKWQKPFTTLTKLEKTTGKKLMPSLHPQSMKPSAKQSRVNLPSLLKVAKLQLFQATTRSPSCSIDKYR